VSSTNGQDLEQEIAPEVHEEPSLLSMMALVAIIVAVVILVFFALGYLFGRAFL
jgi:hypothetical protein